MVGVLKFQTLVAFQKIPDKRSRPTSDTDLGIPCLLF